MPLETLAPSSRLTTSMPRRAAASAVTLSLLVASVASNLPAKALAQATPRPGVAGPTAAQPPAGRAPAAKPPAGKGSAPKVGSGQTTPAAPMPATGAGSTPRPVTAEGDDYSGAQLPADFVPPRKPPAYLTREGVKELITAEQERTLPNELLKEKAGSVMSAGDLNDATKKVVDKVARFHVHQMTLSKYYILKKDTEAAPGTQPAPARTSQPPQTIASLRKKLVQSVNEAGRLKKDDAPAVRRFREYYCQQIVNRAEELLDGHMAVRLNAVLLLAELNSVPADSKANIRDEPYVEAAPALIKVIADKAQPESVKIPAARGLARICLQGKPKAELKLRIGLALVSEFQRKDTHFWYQSVLADALGSQDSVLDQSQRPFVAQALSEALVDDGRHCLVRSEAARSLGRIPLEGNVNIPLVAYEIARFAQVMSENLDKEPTAIHWRECYWKVYCAFHPENAAARDRGEGLLTRVDKGAGAKHKPFVQEAYQLCLPLFVHVFDPKQAGMKFPAKLTEPLEEWLKNKRPEDNRVAPSYKPLVAADTRRPPQ